MAKPTDPASVIYEALRRIKNACVDDMGDIYNLDPDELEQYRSDLLLVHKLSSIRGEK